MDGADAKKKEMDEMMEEFKKRIKANTKIITVEKGMLCKVVIGKTAPGADAKDGPPVEVFYEPAVRAEDDQRVVLVLPKGKNN